MKVGKRPYCIRKEDESAFFIGGMWDVWHAKEEDRLYMFTVLTTFPNDASGMVHDRMPVIVYRRRTTRADSIPRTRTLRTSWRPHQRG